ncbi:MAG: hypothetical protein PHO10_07365 [Gemmiger sp.]|nr:hypothetical protein [Gemmiger sp.]
MGKKSVLILGKGGFGVTLAELLLQNGWRQAAFLDDAAPGCLGKLADYIDPALQASYPAAFVGMGDNTLRVGYLAKLAAAGYRTPVFIHPAAVVSPTATLGPGTVVLPFAYVGAGAALGAGCIVNAGAIVDHNATLEAGVHAAPGAIIKAGAAVPAYAKVESGRVVASPWEAGAK